MAIRQRSAPVHDGPSGTSRRQIAQALATLRTGNIHGFEIRNRRAVNHVAQRIKTRAVTRAVPRFLARIPAHDAPQVWTHRRKRVQVSVLIAIRRDLFHTVTQYCAFIRLDLIHRLHRTGRDVIAKLRSDVGVLDDVIRKRSWLQRLARGVVQFCPWVFAPRDQVRDQDSRHYAVRDAIAGIAGDNINIFIARISADVSYAVDWFHHLPGPAVSDFVDEWKSLPRPPLEFRE